MLDLAGLSRGRSGRTLDLYIKLALAADEAMRHEEIGGYEKIIIITPDAPGHLYSAELKCIPLIFHFEVRDNLGKFVEEVEIWIYLKKECEEVVALFPEIEVEGTKFEGDVETVTKLVSAEVLKRLGAQISVP